MLSSFIVLLISFYFLIQSGRWLVKSLLGLSALLSISSFLVSFVLMSFATTLPEFFVSLNASFFGSPRLAIGNALGSNIVNLGLVLGLTAILSGRVVLKTKLRRFDAWSTLIMGLAPLIILLDGSLSRLDGIILISLFIMYLSKLIYGQHLFTRGGSFWWSVYNHDKNALAKTKRFISNLSLFTWSAIVLIISSYLVVLSVESLALHFGISELIIGVFLLAFGTSLPELVFALRSSFSQHSDMSLGNLIGASAFNSTWIIGLAVIINPLTLNPDEFISFFVLASAVAIILLVSNIFIRTKGYIGRSEGLILICLYLLFVTINLFII